MWTKLTDYEGDPFYFKLDEITRISTRVTSDDPGNVIITLYDKSKDWSQVRVLSEEAEKFIRFMDRSAFSISNVPSLDDNGPF